MQPWWDEVKPLTGAEEPFLYIYLPSSVSGGLANRVDLHPQPCERLFNLVTSLRSGRFPDHLSARCPHIREALAGARQNLEAMLEDTALFDETKDEEGLSPADAYQRFRDRYLPVRERYLSSAR